MQASETLAAPATHEIRENESHSLADASLATQHNGVIRPRDERVVIIAPLGQDATALRTVLNAESFETEVCETTGEGCEHLKAGAAALLLTEEALELPTVWELFDVLKQQPAWSELPLIILTSGGESRVARLLDLAAEAAGAVTLLERPISARTLLRSVQVAFNSRRRQYQVRDLLDQQREDHQKLREGQESARKQAEQLQIILSSIADSFVSLDREWRYTYVNSQAAHTLGKTQRELIGHRPWEFFSEAEHNEVRSAGDRAMANQQPATCQQFSPAFRRWFENYIYPSPNGLSIHWRDITENKRAEEALRKIRDELAAELADTRLLQHLSAQIIHEENVGAVYDAILDTAVAIMRSDFASIQKLHPERGINGELRLLAFRGFDPKTAKFWEWVSPDSKSSCGIALHTRERVAVPDLEQWEPLSGSTDQEAYRQAGIRAVQTTPLLSRGGKLLGMISTHWRRPHQPSERDCRLFDILARQAADLIERKSAEEKLRDSEAQFRAMADNIAPLAWMANADGGLFFYNKRWYDYTGSTLEQMQGWGWEKLLHPEHSKRVMEKWAAHLQRGEDWEDTFPLLGANGQYRWFLSRAFPIRETGGRIVRWFGTNTDVTELREAQELLGSRGKQLEQLVEQRTSELRETVQQLEAFSYSIAHDMRAPLRSLQGFGQFLKEEYAEKIDAKGQNYLHRIITSAARMDRLIQDVLNYSQILRGELPLQPIGLEKLINGILDSYPALQEEGTTIQLEGSFPNVTGNEAFLTQVFSNLLSNAVKFVAPGTKPVVRVWAETRADRVRIFVQDNGIGIPPEQQKKLFAIFQRVSKTYDGTGIGLAIVKKAAERMGGQVGLESRLGQGSTFWIELQNADQESK